MAKTKVTLRLDDKVVNATTFFVSSFFRIVFLVLALICFAVSTPLTASQVGGIAAGVCCLALAKSLVLTFEDK